MGADEASVVGINLCQALAAVHGAGVLHRDVKARNVMREAGGRIVLMDFGAGRELVAKTPSTRPMSDFSGTPLYLAPELFTGGEASRASDLYSLGVLLFFLVTRKYPVEGASLSELVLKHSAGERRLLSDLRPDLPTSFVQVVQRALSPKPEQRQQSAGALMAELSRAMPHVRQDEGDTPALVAPPAPAPRRLSFAVRLAIGAAAVLIAVGGFGFLTTAHYDSRAGPRTRILRCGSWHLVRARCSIDGAARGADGGVLPRVPPCARDLVLHEAPRAAGAARRRPGANEHLRPVPPSRAGCVLRRSGLARSAGAAHCRVGVGVLADARDASPDREYRGAAGASRSSIPTPRILCSTATVRS